MIIFDEENTRSINLVTLLLTHSEMCELRDSIELILNTSDKARHEHVSDITYQKEITVALYNDDTKSSFSKEIQQLFLK